MGFVNEVLAVLTALTPTVGPVGVALLTCNLIIGAVLIYWMRHALKERQEQADLRREQSERHMRETREIRDGAEEKLNAFMSSHEEIIVRHNAFTQDLMSRFLHHETLTKEELADIVKELHAHSVTLARIDAVTSRIKY
jgi:uncharacterized protein HemX